jgi:hypothetical protein
MEDAMPRTAMTAAKPQPGRCRPRLKFPCGHLEAEAAVEKRTHASGRAVWVRCRSCNLIALAIAVDTARVASRRSPRRTLA